MNERRYSTAIHEVGHTVVAYVVGKRVMHVVLSDDKNGEAMPHCAGCDTCADYFLTNEPTKGSHSETIQDDLRRDAAAAIAGEVVELAICGDQYLDPDEIYQDLYKARGSVAMTHYWIDRRCHDNINSGYYPPPCIICDAYLDTLKQSVMQIVETPEIKKSVLALAERLVNLDNGLRIHEVQIHQFLVGKGLVFGSMFGLLPSAPRD